MKRFNYTILCLTALTVLAYTANPAVARAQEEILLDQQQVYSVFFRNDGNAVVTAMFQITNNSNRPLTDYSFEIPNAKPVDVAIYQQNPTPVCVQYNYELSGHPCIKFDDQNIQPVKNDSFGESGSEAIANFTKIDYEQTDSLFKFTFVRSVKPQKTTTIALSYTSSSYTKEFAGRLAYTFQTAIVPYRVNSVRVGVDAEVGYFMNSLSAGIPRATISNGKLQSEFVFKTSGEDYDPIISQYANYIGVSSPVFTTANDLAPNESFAISGAYASSWWRLYLVRIVTTILVIAFLLINFLLIRRLRIRKYVGTAMANNLSYDHTVSQPGIRTPFILSSALWVFITLVLICLWIAIITIWLPGASVAMIDSYCNSAKCASAEISPAYENVAYEIDGRNIEFKDGISISDNSTNILLKSSFQYIANEAWGDLNNDRREDVVFLLTKSTPGNGTFFYVVASLNTPQGYQGTNGFLLGDRIVPKSTQISDSEIIVNYSDRNKDEPMTAAPTVNFLEFFIVDKGRLMVHARTTMKDKTYQVADSDEIQVEWPLPNSTVGSPLLVNGTARGSWFFNGSFPVKLMDSYGRVLSSARAKAYGDLATNDFVPFQASLSFVPQTDVIGTVVLGNGNSLGFADDTKEIHIPIVISKAEREWTVRLYYYNPNKDKDANGNILCSSQGLVSVDRRVPRELTTRIENALRLLLQGELTMSERSAGATTGFPLPGVVLNSAVEHNGVLTLDIDDLTGLTRGDPCKVAVLVAQIEATAKQFVEVKSIKFTSTNVFTP